jgi:azurin
LAEEPSKRVVAHYQITGLVGKAYLKLATAAIAANGFQKTCLFPCNYIFDKHDPGGISVQHQLLFA